MPIFVACSTIGSANGVILTSSRYYILCTLVHEHVLTRLFYAGAREGQMPQVLTMINPSTKTPIPAVIVTVCLDLSTTQHLIIQGLLSLCYLAMSNNIFSLINYIQIVYWLAIGSAILALFWLRKTMPDAPRPIKVVDESICFNGIDCR